MPPSAVSTHDAVVYRTPPRRADALLPIGRPKMKKVSGDIAFAAAVIAAILGVAASNFGQGWFAPWFGVMMTLAAAATAYGLLDRRQYLAGAYGAMVTRLSRKELFADGAGNLAALV